MALTARLTKHLLKLNAVAHHVGQGGSEVERRFDALPSQFRAEEEQHFLDYGVKRHRRSLGLGARRHVADAPNDVRCAPCIRDGARGQCPEFVQIRLRTFKPEQRSLTVGENRAQRLIDFVRYRSGKLAQHGHSRRMSEFGLHLRQHCLGFHPIADVDQTPQTQCLLSERLGKVGNVEHCRNRALAPS
jgi:hypothetical protein